MFAESVADHERHAALGEQKTAERRAALADVSAMLDVANDQVAAIERGEDVPGGLGKPPDLTVILKAAGLTDADIRDTCDEHEVYRLLAGDDETRADIVQRKFAEVSVEKVTRFEQHFRRKFIRRLLRNLRAEASSLP